MDTIQLHNVSPEEFSNKILLGVDQRIKRLEKEFQPKEPTRFLTRHAVAELLSITLPTLHDWTKKHILKAYRIGNRVLYKAHEVEQSLTLIDKKS